MSIVGVDGFRGEAWVGVELSGGVPCDRLYGSRGVLDRRGRREPVAVHHIRCIFEQTPDVAIQRLLMRRMIRAHCLRSLDGFTRDKTSTYRKRATVQRKGTDGESQRNQGRLSPPG